VRVAFVGFGALAGELAAHARRSGAEDVRVHVRERRDPTGAEALAARIAAAGVRWVPSLPAAVAGADVVMAAVPAAAAAEVARACAPHLAANALYADPAPLHPDEKASLAEIVERGGPAFVDVAVLGTVTTAGALVPMIASGRGAERWTEAFGAMGFDVRLVPGPPGRASLIKLVRSVYLKGRDALVLEMLEVARHHGIEEEVLMSIGGAGEQVPFTELADRVLRSLALYAGRRADELDASARVAAEAGVDPVMTEAAAARLRALAATGLRDRFHGERPGSLDEVLTVLSEIESR
jgi:3-hydroxyisobutyrate dehydrogenase-like beta-hydroxyacid dehydrogenase